MKEAIRENEFEAAAMPHLNDLFRTAARVVGNRTEAEDLVQETYLQAWKSFDRFEVGTNCRAWLFKILFHLIAHHRRRNYRFSVVSESEDVIQDLVAYEPPVPQHITDEDVLTSLERVPQHYREVILLADVDGFAYKEIAEILSIPQGTVMSRLNRGRKMLREELAAFACTYRIRAVEEKTRIASA